MAEQLIVIEHAVLADRLSVLRDRDTTHGQFRQALFEASAIMAVEVARELPVKEVDIETPLETTRGLRIRPDIFMSCRRGLGGSRRSFSRDPDRLCCPAPDPPCAPRSA